MNTTIFIVFFIVIVVVYTGFMIFMNKKRKSQQAMLANTDFTAAFSDADRYLQNFIINEVPYLQKEMKGQSIEALTYANASYNNKDAIKDGIKDGLKGLATLGTVRFTTLQTPKYLVLNSGELHLFDTDTDGDISEHYVFNPTRLQESTIEEVPLTGNLKAFALQKGEHTKAYKLTLASKNGPMEVIIFSALVFTFASTAASPFSMNAEKWKEEIVIASDFLKKLGDQYPNLKVQIPLMPN